MKTALITGALGQDGRLLARRLVDQDCRVIGVVRPSSDSPPDVLSDRLRLVTMDLTDVAAASDLLAEHQPDEIYHLAAAHHSSQESHDSSGVATLEAMVAHNFLSTRALAFAMARTGSRAHLVFAASSQMYTPRSDCDEISEETPRSPRTFYGHTKAWSQDLLAFLRARSGLRASTAILFNHESPLRSPQFVTRKITQAAARAWMGSEARLKLLNVGARVDWGSAHDVVRALQLMGGQEAGRDYVVASGELHSVRELLEAAFGHVGLDWQRHTDYEMDVTEPALLGRPRRLCEELGWQRAMSFRDMVIEMVERDMQLTRRGSM